MEEPGRPNSTWRVVSGCCGGNTGCNVWGWDKRLNFYAAACLVADDSSITRDIGSSLIYDDSDPKVQPN